MFIRDSRVLRMFEEMYPLLRVSRSTIVNKKLCIIIIQKVLYILLGIGTPIYGQCLKISHFSLLCLTLWAVTLCRGNICSRLSNTHNLHTASQCALKGLGGFSSQNFWNWPTSTDPPLKSFVSKLVEFQVFMALIWEKFCVLTGIDISSHDEMDENT